jgi:hypothetical protein
MLAAAAGAMLSGIGFATLQPSLTLIAIDRLDPRRRQAGAGVIAEGFAFGGDGS